MAYRLNYSDYVTSEGPPDPSEWVGPPGPVGPVGPKGEKGDPGSLSDGGTLDGPLLFTATGSTTPRSAQDRAADVANVLDFGADPTRTVDSTAAFQAAAAYAGPRDKTVYVPAGGYIISGPITLTGKGGIRGVGRMASLLQISGSFPLGALGVLIVNAPETGLVIERLWIRFSQADTSVRANITQYPPAIYTTNDRLRIRNCYITQAWTGVYANNAGGMIIEGLDCSAYSRGLWISQNNPALDMINISKYHFGNFDQTLNQCAVMWDGTTLGADIGRVDGLSASDWLLWRSSMVIGPTAGTPGWYLFTNLMMDGSTCTVTINNAFRCQIANAYFSKGGAETPALVINGGITTCTNLQVQSSMTSTAAVQVTGGQLEIMGGGPWWKEVAGCELITVSGGMLVLRSVLFNSHVASHTAPFIHQSGTGVLNVDGCVFPSGVTGVAAQMDAAASGALLGSTNSLFALTVTGAGVPTTTFPTPITSPTINGTLTIGTSAATTNTVINGPASSNRQILWQSAGKNFWQLRMFNAETGSGNVGADWALFSGNDAGTLATAPAMQINRATGMMTVPAGVTVGTDTVRQWVISNGQASSGRGMYIHTASVQRLFIGSTGTESGSDTGADFGVQTYNDAGASLGIAVSITRATGQLNALKGLAISSASGPTIRAGTGAATGTQPKGSLWLRTDGAAGSTLYVTQGAGVWAAVTGV